MYFFSFTFFSHARYQLIPKILKLLNKYEYWNCVPHLIHCEVTIANMYSLFKVRFWWLVTCTKKFRFCKFSKHALKTYSLHSLYVTDRAHIKQIEFGKGGHSNNTWHFGRGGGRDKGSWEGLGVNKNVTLYFFSFSSLKPIKKACLIVKYKCHVTVPGGGGLK